MATFKFTVRARFGTSQIGINGGELGTGNMRCGKGGAASLWIH